MKSILRTLTCLVFLGAAGGGQLAWAESPELSDATGSQQQEELSKAIARYEGNREFSNGHFDMYPIVEAATRGNSLALVWLENEAMKNSDAMVSLGYYYVSKKDGNNAIAQFKRAAQSGSKYALSVMADTYEKGWHGVRKDLKVSCEWRRQSAESGNFNDAVEYGYCLSGNVGGIQRDMNESCRWGEVGAKGFAEKMAYLQKEPKVKWNDPHWRDYKQSASRAYGLFALCLQVNPSTKSRVAEAAKWYKEAADLGHNVASFLYGELLEQGSGVVQNYAEASRRYRDAAEGGYAEAQNRIGVKYAEGKGVQKNMLEAMKWFIIAVANGEEKAVDNREKAEKSLSPADIKKAQAMAAEWMKKNRPQ